MRHIWDRKKEKKKVEKCPLFTQSKIFPLELKKHHLDYLARKKAFLGIKDEIVKAFADYEKHLGNAGFSKI